MRAFLQSGGSVAFLGSLPCQTPDRGDDPQITRDANQLLADFPQSTIHLAAASQRDQLTAWINNRAPAQVTWKGPHTVRILRRQEPNREILLVANPSNQDNEGQLTMPIAGKASVWNPETGKIQPIDSVSVGQQVLIKVPSQSARIVVVEQRKK